jgi:paraquat-inducible protein A
MNPDSPSNGLRSISTSAALATASAVMLVPANLLPVLSTQTSGQAQTNTIFSGVVELWSQGLWAIAVIVFSASIVIPALKLGGLAWLLLNARRIPRADARKWAHLYAVLDLIGRWSMLDVFLVTFLTGLIQFGLLATVEPRSGIVAFASVVVLTMLATQAFDPRMLWREDDRHPSPVSPS